ncbi:MAG: carboxypeptidase-like regulatory domain-containing protein, partial [Bacteroidaceae bacterium]|nr:carboxypeptidase-like regulatory domain-containing protein [Bacteroidaceae bacterium]
MKVTRICLLFLFTFSPFHLFTFAQDSVSAVVIDAETGEPVPYASIYVSSSCGTISNYDGEFSLECLPSDVLRISSIGYQRVSHQASHLPDTILMKPISSTLRELTVLGTDDLLYRLVRKMQKETKKYKKTASNYFFRLTTQYPGTDELAEAFLSAKSCVQLRDMTFHSGNRGVLKEPGVFDSPDLKGLGRTNLHVFLRLAPIITYYNE